MTEQEIQTILEKQHKFFATGHTIPIFYRQEMLKKLKKSLTKHERELNTALKKDLGKSQMESYMCEVGLTLSELTWMQKHLKGLAKEKRVPTPLAQFASRSFRSPSPYGTVLIMSPWNYPVLLTMDPLIDAIAAGNTVVLKPSAYAPATSAVMKMILEECFPQEYVAVITGGRAENQALLHQRFDKIFFTGGKTVGKEVLRCAAEHLTPVTLELGGKSPCIVDHTAKLNLAAKRIVFGKYLNCGQTCVAPDYILCDRRIRDDLITAIVKEIQLQFGEQPLENPDYGKIINQKHFERILGLINHEKLVFGGESDPETLRIAPTVMKDITWEDAVMGEEIFGPLMPILTYDTLDEAIQVVESHPHPLALYFFSEDKASQKKVLDSCHFGGGCMNDTIIHLATSAMPFGGVGESGMGGYHGKVGFETFSHTRSIVDKKTWMDLPIRYQKYNSIKEKMLRIFLR
ncbi:MAG: aldehyde dehydrogenase [Dorea sp.]